MDTAPYSERERFSRVDEDGQPFVYDPVYVILPETKGSQIAEAVGKCFDRKFLGCYERVKLNWKRPGQTR